MLISVVTCVGTAVALFLLIRKSLQSGPLPVTAEWIDELSLERYRPMMRLLDSRDIEYLLGQPGFTPRMAARLRAQRCQIFRGYLRSLSADFDRVCAAIKILLLESRQDRPELASVLMQHQFMFASRMLLVQVHVFFYRWGLCSVDVTGLVKIFDRTQLELRKLVPATVLDGAGA